MLAIVNSRYRQQLAMYSSYHRDPRNRATHFVGVPAIVFALLIPLARLPVPGTDGWLTAATLLAVGAGTYWVSLDRRIGIATTLAVLVPLLVAHRISGLDARESWAWFALFFVGGWILQLIGHVFEGRRPAFTDNLLQVLIAPLFLVAEALGQEPDGEDRPS